ncbi:hypothetical protein [Nocardia sp. NPDC051832]|uniref:hypothetical protein n=1 Tax=Nocardia sp. NPDC051832 TaxID=3155673 RepID=UPI00341BDB9F
MDAPEPMHDLARGDVGVSRQLSRALRVLLDTATDPQLKDQLRGILEGKGSARDLLHNEAFNQVLDQTLPAAMQQFAEMPEEERQRLAEQGEAELERLRSDVPTEPPAEQQPAEPPAEPRLTAPPAESRPTEPAPTAEARPTSPVVPGTRKPNREVIVTPDDDDEDDEYFRDRRQHGWLE